VPANDVKVVDGYNGTREGLEVSKISSNGPPSLNATKFSHLQTKCVTKNNNFDENRRRERDLNSVVILEETDEIELEFSKTYSQITN